jgi:Reverse transcriptase (RNA-dependent DNA polymerase)
MWYHKLKQALCAISFKTLSSDPSLFLFRNESTVAFLLVYVDDIVLTGNNNIFLNTVVQLLDQQFTKKDLENLHFFLDIEVTPFQQGLLLTQTKYIYSILDRANMLGAKPINTPMATSAPLSKFNGEVFQDPSLYRSVVGALQYATITRSEISFAVNRVSQFMHAPTTEHWGAVKRILRYLKGSLNHGLHLQPSDHLAIHAFIDSDWAGCPDDRMSTAGYLVFFGNNLVSWCSKKQSTVARSTTEAEYRAIAMVTAEVTWLQSLIHELGFDVPSPVLWCDNLGATFLAANLIFHARTKHIELDFHFMREKVAAGTIQVRFICSKNQLVDVLTKPLSVTRFNSLKSKFTVANSTLRLRGRDNGHIQDSDVQRDTDKQGMNT